jgi:hypothetical protein
MYKSWSECETIILPMEIVLYLIDDIRLIGLMIPCVDIDPSWFIHYHEILILIEDLEFF